MISITLLLICPKCTEVVSGNEAFPSNRVRNRTPQITEKKRLSPDRDKDKNFKKPGVASSTRLPPGLLTSFTKSGFVTFVRCRQTISQ